MAWRWSGRALVPLLAGVLASGCGSTEAEARDASCVPTDTFFAQQVWQPFLGSQCYSCHNVQGTARDSDLILLPPSQPDYLRINLERLQNVARVEIDGTSLLLLKPTARVDHGGGKQLEEGSRELRALEELVHRFENPVTCSQTGSGDALRGLELLSPVETLRKATLSLAGRLPTIEEESRVEAGGEAALSTVLDEVMTEEAFFDRVKEFWNDLLLTDRYRGWDRAIQLLDSTDYPNRAWYQPPEGTTVDEAEVNRLRSLTNEAVAREPLELIAHVVREHRPFGEILTARYRLVNPFSAKSYGLQLPFGNPDDPQEWREAQMPGIENAGVLTSPMFLNRFPTTETNRNRNRARTVFRLFLATDILKLAERPVDPTNIEDFNPTMYNPACTVCHAPMDPVAGAFQNQDARGRYRPPESGWYEEMRPPGYGEATVPFAERTRSLEWLGGAVAADPLFVTATVRNAWTLLTGEEPLQPPADPLAPGAAPEQEAFDAQSAHFREVGEAFVAANSDFTVALRELILGPWYRANGVDPDAKPNETLDFVSSGKLLTPEALDRKIEAVTGYPWRPWVDSRNSLTDPGQYQIFYGGIDSEQITRRIVEPNGVMANVQGRMANEMACRTVSRDFTLDAADRLLFPLVERSYEPEDENGFEVPGAAEAIRENIRYLHERFLGEELFPGDPEIERTFALFYETWKEGRSGMADGSISTSLHWACGAGSDWWTGEELPEERRVQRDERYTVRAWMAVISYLLLDSRFLYE